jgi:hypothetical protein
MRWNTSEFVKEFKRGTLGRKRVHGTFRVLDGDHCQLLVRSSTRRGRPAGNKVVAIKFNQDGSDGMMFYHWHNTSSFTYGVNRDLDVYNENKMPLRMMSGDEDNLLNSGIIAEDGKHVLLEIGDIPWLLYKNEALQETKLTFSKARQLHKRVQTIEAALEDSNPPEGAVEISNTWWATPTDSTFTPPELDLEVEATLKQGLNAMSFGFTPDECSVQRAGAYGSDALSILVPLGWKQIDNNGVHPHDSRVTRFVAAYTKWEKAIKTYTERSPMEYKGIHCRKDRYNNTARNRVGRIIRSSQGVFIKGEFRATCDWSDVTKVTTWHKLHSLCNVINMGLR